MAKTEVKKVMDIEATRMWYRDYAGRTASVIKYKDPYGMEDEQEPETVPIYVCLSGREPELLINALVQLETLRGQKATSEKEEESAIADNVWTLQNRVDKLEKRLSKWWKFWSK